MTLNIRFEAPERRCYEDDATSVMRYKVVDHF